MNIARMFGWVIERQEDTKGLQARLREMTPEQRKDHAASVMVEVHRTLSKHAARQAAKDTATDADFEELGTIGGGR